MCYESFLNGDAADEPVLGLLRGELGSALKDGTIAAVLVALVLGWAGGGVVPVVVRSVGAFVLGVALHQAVLLAGIAALRTHRRATSTAPLAG